MAAEARKQLRILLVEDESVIAMMVSEMLGDLGHKVVGPAGRLKQAIEMAQRETFDLAIIDVNLHGTESYPVADVLAARGIPFVFATGYEQMRLRAPFGNRPVLQKPFREEDLSSSIEACVQNHQAT